MLCDVRGVRTPKVQKLPQRVTNINDLLVVIESIITHVVPKKMATGTILWLLKKERSNAKERTKRV